jgi:hypothetical protein
MSHLLSGCVPQAKVHRLGIHHHVCAVVIKNLDGEMKNSEKLNPKKAGNRPPGRGPLGYIHPETHL